MKISIFARKSKNPCVTEKRNSAGGVTTWGNCGSKKCPHLTDCPKKLVA